ncbi:1,4-alpha-glucan branching protein GlgB [Eubacterium xylanophilum]|uniref:1,4-alpha-glucan branching protein GlgB n=1 Tax=Eubacterium xylanophilum TaxID=39497 RepID=UPI0006872F5D|nr:1,4-alpha-glucan branching protein GlgB [Eubacterium xylanophilum]
MTAFGVIMKYVLDDFMEWPQIEDLEYAECEDTSAILGAVKVGNKVLVRCFFPDAKRVEVHYDQKSGHREVEMKMMDESGYFAIFLDCRKIPEYTYMVEYEDKKVMAVDAYAIDPFVDAMDEVLFEEGRHDSIYEKLGCHVAEVNGVVGAFFAVWAPEARSVSVVGDFNNWDGKYNQMKRLNTGIFELFVPGVRPGDIYKYEIHGADGKVVCKADPYARHAELRPAGASKVWSPSGEFEWKDKKWMDKRKKIDKAKDPMVVLEVHMGSFMRPRDGREFYTYREMGERLSEYCANMGYTHIELMPIMEHPYDKSWGYQVTGYYAPTSRYGTPEEFKEFINILHGKGIGVILDWVPAHFPKDEHGLGRFDGTCLYEHLDKRKGEHPDWGTLIYNYGRPQVSNFLYANLLYWMKEFHVDGFRFDAVASMLYLDYGRKDGEWVTNEFGGKENLEAVEFLKKCNTVVKENDPSILMIAEESTAWPMVTGDVNEGSLGFDLKWNMGWMNDYTEYICTDPLYRKGRHGMLTFSMVYNYSEHFSLVFSHDEVVHGKGSMYSKMPGNADVKLAGLRLTYGYMAAHPGKILLFMGQDFGQQREWNEEGELDWSLLEDGIATLTTGEVAAIKSNHKLLLDYTKELWGFYKKHPALHELDYDPEGFKWVSMLDADHSIIAFMREADKEKLLVVCNFTPVCYENFVLGVPYKGKYKEIWNSDEIFFGGRGNVNPRVKNSKEDKADGMEQSIDITVAPMAIQIFEFSN